MQEMKDLEEPFKKPDIDQFELQPFSSPTSVNTSPRHWSPSKSIDIGVHFPLASLDGSFFLDDKSSPQTPNARHDKTNQYVNLDSYRAYFCSFYTRCIPMALNRMVPIWMNLISLRFIAWYANAHFSAAFGLGSTIFMLFFGIMNVIHCEAMGICITQAFQANDYQKMRVVFYRALIIKAVISIANVVFFYYIDVILLAMNFDPEVSR
jgi:hypothetical protein